MTRKVSLKWLATSDDPLAVEYRKTISGSLDCALCCMFFEDEYTDTEGNTSKCSFNEIDESELEHFQQMAKIFRFDIKIISLGNTEEPKEVVQFT